MNGVRLHPSGTLHSWGFFLARFFPTWLARIKGER